MKKKVFHVSHYILVAVIFGGISLFSVLAAYHVVFHAFRNNTDPSIPLVSLSVVVVALSALASYTVMAVVLKPLVKFIRTAEKLPILAQTAQREPSTESREEIGHISNVLDHVTEILGSIESKEQFPAIVGQSRAIRALLGQIVKVAPTDSTALISGESGTGKELVATAIYEHSQRKRKPFVKINCVAIPEGLMESELFGHEKGAFTGAVAQKKGKFELADGGTIFLDEIGDMPSATQAKLLRVLQEKQFERVGGTQMIHVDIRVIAATNKNLLAMIKAGTFREDLYYRLNVFSLHLPPLRDRREDIPLLTSRFLENVGRDVTVSPAAMQWLIGCDWPGNIRQLQNTIERAAVLADSVIELSHLPTATSNGYSISQSIADDEKSLDEKMATIEKGMIIEALIRTNGVQARAARLLGINQRSLWHRIKKLQIDTASLKSYKMCR